jgi:hypothetical protein
LRIAGCSPVGLINHPLVRYRLHAKSTTAREEPRLTLEGQVNIVERAVARDVERLMPLRDRALANCYIAAAGIYARREKWPEAQQAYLQAMKHTPALAKAYGGWIACLLGGSVWRTVFNLRRRLFWH